MISQIGLSFLIPLCLSLLLTPVVIWLAPRIGAVDLPNARKIHSQPMPRLGGAAICMSFMLSLVLLFLIVPDMPFFTPAFLHKGGMLVASLLLVFALGIWDDIKTLNPGQKFLVQVLAATLVYLAGFRISAVTNLLGTGLLDIGFLDYPATVLWIVGVTNAINLIDGLDGLASGVSLIAFLTIGAISFLKDDLITAMIMLVLAGAVMGFLRYNFNPARIFLGDSGSLFIGFALASLAMQSETKGSTAFAILVPVLALGLPIMDTLLAMTRRLLHAMLPEEKSHSGSLLHKLHAMFLPDRQHIHHQLIAKGLRHRHAVLLLYLVSCAFGIGALAVTVANNMVASLILIAVAMAMFVGIRQLHYKEMAILHNGILLPLYEWPVMNRALLKGFFDLGFSCVAFAMAYFLTFRDAQAMLEPPFFSTLAAVGGIQLIVFYLSGLYKSSYRYLGIGDLLKIAKNVILAVLVIGFALMLHPKTYPFTIFVLDFYFLLSLIVGTRVSFYVLNRLFRQESRDREGRYVLIYGADDTGLLTLQQILNDETLDLAPIGFLDEAPRLEGKRLDGLPIYSHWKLHRLLNTHKIDQILLPRDTISPEVFRRLSQVANRYGIIIKRSKVHLEDLSSDIRIPAA